MFEFILDKLIGLMGPIATLSRDKRELKDNALKAISKALRETKLYYQARDRGEGRNYETEANLVRLWSEASVPLRHIDEHLSILCIDKSEYWINPDNWSENDIKSVGIKLEDVSQAYRKLAGAKSHYIEEKNA